MINSRQNVNIIMARKLFKMQTEIKNEITNYKYVYVRVVRLFSLRSLVHNNSGQIFQINEEKNRTEV